MRSKGGPTRSAYRASASALALLALLLNLFAGLLPMPALAGTAGAFAAICSSNPVPPDDGTPGIPGVGHDCQVCLTQKLSGGAVMPAAAQLAPPDHGSGAIAPRLDDPDRAAGRIFAARPRGPPAAA